MQNLKKNWLVVWKMAWGIWEIFTRALQKSQTWDFDGILLSKAEKCVSLKFTEELCVKTLKNDAKFEGNWHVVSKLTWEIWRISAWPLKRLHFNGLLLNKVCNVWAKKVQRSLSHDTEDRYKIEGKLTCGLENDEEFGKLLPEHLKVSKLRLWWDPFIHSRNNVWA